MCHVPLKQAVAWWMPGAPRLWHQQIPLAYDWCAYLLQSATLCKNAINAHASRRPPSLITLLDSGSLVGEECEKSLCAFIAFLQ